MTAPSVFGLFLLPRGRPSRFFAFAAGAFAGVAADHPDTVTFLVDEMCTSTSD
jgi:hypothetical protein